MARISAHLIAALQETPEKLTSRRLVLGIAVVAALWVVSSAIIVPAERGQLPDEGDDPFRLAAAYYGTSPDLRTTEGVDESQYVSEGIPYFISTVFRQVSQQGDYETSINASNTTQMTFPFADINVFIDPPNFPTEWSGEDNYGNPLQCYGGAFQSLAGCYDENVGPGDSYYVSVFGNTQDQTTPCGYEVNYNAGGGPTADHNGDCTFTVQQQGDIILNTPPTIFDPATADQFNFYTFSIENTGSSPATFTLVIFLQPFSGGVNPPQVSGPGTDECEFSSEPDGERATCQLTIQPSSLQEYGYSFLAIGPGSLGTQASITVESGENANTDNDSFFGSTSVLEYVDFVLTKVTEVEHPTINSSFYYYLDLTNLGPSTARNVSLRDVYATGFNFIESNISWGAAMDMGSQAEFGPGDIEAGETERIYYWGQFNDDVFPCSQSERVNSAEVIYSGGVDLDDANNSAFVPIYLCGSSFGGRACFDENGNGICDASEMDVENVRLFSSYFDVFTNVDGEYTVSSLPRWTYEVNVEPPAPYATPGQIAVVVDDDIVTGIDIPLTIPGGDIHIHKFWDKDEDGEQDEDEGGLDGIAFVLQSGANVIREAISAPMDMNSDGLYDPNTERGVVWWQDVPPGEYVLVESVPSGASLTTHASNEIPVSVSANNQTVIFIGNGSPGADWGDLPDPRTDLPGPCPIGGVDLECYKTLAGARGAAHMIDPNNLQVPILGNRIDADPDGQPNVLADGDDLNISSTGGVDDEDGWLETRVLGDGTIEVDVNVFDPTGQGAVVDVFIDLNDDGVLNDGSFPGGAREHVIFASPVVTGVNTLESPPGRFQEGDILGYMRIRITKNGAPFAWGGAPEGEVEDYTHFAFDFGDAPSSEDPLRPQFPWGYPTIIVQNPAFHRVLPGFTLGERIDGETNGQPTQEADGDDAEPTLESDDEDGVRFASDFISLFLALDPASEVETYVPGIVRGTDATIEVTTSAAGYLNAWADWNRDGDWSDDGEQMYDGLPLNPGDTELDFVAPPEAEIGFTYIRFRFTPGQTEIGPGLYEGIGEVEDYLMLTLGRRELESTFDTPDANPGDGICADANGDCTLRAAIMETNAGDTPYVVSADALGKSGMATLTPQSPYPPITGTLILDGNASLEIDGSQAGAGAHGFVFQSGGNLVTSTYLHSFDGDGIRIEGDNNNVFDVRSWNNGGAGINVVSGSGNFLRTNSIDGNAGLGIDLGADGATSNDAGDGDSGPNGLQNHPVISSASANGAAIEGTLNSTPETEFVIDFFTSPACDASGSGEGMRFFGSVGVTTDGSGDGSFDVDFEDAGLMVGDVITATATGAQGTSEFSACFTAVGTEIERTDTNEVPEAYRLSQNYPNPFNPVTTIEFAVPRSEFVRIDVFDLLGKHVARMVNRQVDAGEYTVRFDASALPSGSYIYRMTAGAHTESKHFTLLK